MADKKQNQSQIEKLIEMANQLEKREHALTRESSQLEQLRAELEERERKLDAALKQKPEPALPRKTAAPAPPMQSEPVYPQRQAAAPAPPPVNPQAAPMMQPAARYMPPPAPHMAQYAPPSPPQPRQATPASETIAELADVLTHIFWDYSNSVHQISSQMSTVTAAMMCSAVTCVLENRGFDAKDVFMREMEKMLKGGGLGESGSTPYNRPAEPPKSVQSAPPALQYTPQHGDRYAQQSAPQNAAPAPQYMPPAPPPANAAPAPQSAVQPAPPPAYAAPAPPPGSQVLDVDDDEDAYAVVEEIGMPQRAEDGMLHIETASDFQKLGEYGFRNDEKIVSVDLPEGVYSLPGSFFYGCSKLEEVWLPDSVQEIGPYAFYGCEALRVVHLGENSALREIGEYAFAMCGALQAFDVPAMVETLGTSVFRFCSSLERVTFSRNSRLQTIGSHLLQNCAALERLRLPDSISVIPTSMFYGCAGLQKVVAKGVDTIEDYAFYGNENLRTVRIRAKKVIAPQAFEGCSPGLEIEYFDY